MSKTQEEVQEIEALRNKLLVLKLELRKTRNKTEKASLQKKLGTIEEKIWDIECQKAKEKGKICLVCYEGIHPMEEKSANMHAHQGCISDLPTSTSGWSKNCASCGQPIPVGEEHKMKGRLSFHVKC